MSRLTASPFHKPSPFEFPRTLPASPPETNSDSAGASGPLHEATVSVAGGIEALHSESDFLPFHHNGADSMASRLRRGPSLHYQSSGIREAKERIVQRGLKSFIIVVPPPVLLQEHGQLGHTLSLGPRHRLAQGMLMPLFPTMYGQLAAIAREYNFPSTTGLCLYFHYSENGVTATPRISDDSWQMVWGPFLDATHHSQRPPICGKIEFDIDLRFARWYHAWISSSHRDHVDVPMSVVPSTAPSVAHFRTDSRNTDVELPHDDHGEASSVAPQSTARHIPKKLSLVDRLDTFSNRSFSRPPSRDRSGLSPPEQVAPTQALSPIFQEDEPKTAKIDLEKRVNNWRVSASLTATSLAFKQGQVSLEPANIPNNVPLDNVLDYEVGELNLEDFAWSVSSQGPGDYDEATSIASWDRIPSVHLAGRLEGSVCMTPSTVTSFGPSDYTLPSPIPSSERAYTPDLAFRQFEDMPLTPTTATSWGPPSEYASSLYSHGSMSSLGLVHRLTFSRPTTPTTATSWGPSSWPTSPMESIDSRGVSIHLGDRGDFSRPATPTTATTWGPSSWPSSPMESINSDVISIHLGDRGTFSRPVTPSTATSWGAPLSYPPSPVSPYRVRTPDAGERTFEEGALAKSLPWFHGWPYQGTGKPSHTKEESTPWTHGWPYGTEPMNQASPWLHGWPYQASQGSSSTRAEPWALSWPYRNEDLHHTTPWSHGWPYHSTAQGSSPILRSSRTTSMPWAHNWPYRASNSIDQSLGANSGHVWPIPSDPWRHGWPYTQKVIGIPMGVNHSQDSAGSHKDTHTQLHLTVSRGQAPKNIDLRLGYPYLQLYPVGYPHNLECIYPQAIEVGLSHSRFGYPDNLYQIYPAISRHIARNLRTERVRKQVIVRLKASYSNFDLYPAVYPGNLTAIYPPTLERSPSAPPERQKAVNVRAVHSYPIFLLYPAVYPWNLEEIYPVFVQDADVKKGPGYPYFDLYPAVYPHFDLYPAVNCSTLSNVLPVRNPIAKLPISVNVDVRYPTFVIYRPIYPFISVYPDLPRDIRPSSKCHVALKERLEMKVISKVATAVALCEYTYPHIIVYPPLSEGVGFGRIPTTPRTDVTRVNYPFFNLYPATYPHFDLYPPISGGMDVKHIALHVNVQYPVFDLYPAVYPYFDLYPPISGGMDVKHIVLNVNVQYPVFDLYPATYPYFGLFSGGMDVKYVVLDVNVQYPVFDLYPAVYPHINVYPAVSGRMDPVRDTYKNAGNVNYPIFDLYPAVYPHFNLYPPVSGLTIERYEVVVRLPARYPAFELYEPVYPHFSLWPAIQPAMRSPTILRTRKTHAQLHHLALLEAPRRKKLHVELHYEVLKMVGNMGKVKRSKTHLALHHEVFPHAANVNTPSGTSVPTVHVVRIPDFQPSISPPTRLRSSSISRRPGSVTPPPTQGLPPRPDSHRSTVQVVEFAAPVPDTHRPSRVSSVDPRSHSSSNVAQPLRRSASSVTSSSRTYALHRMNGLPTVDEQPAITPLARSSSLSDSSRSRLLNRTAESVTSNPSPTPSPRKRDSLVLQRVRAINASFEDDDSSVLSLTNRFPMPPRPPLPSRPPV